MEQVWAGHRGRLWIMALWDRVLLVTAYWHTHLPLRQLAPPFGVSRARRVRLRPSPPSRVDTRR
ncbi:hypothetical protein GCM10010423_33530 [Streptomyces levis]|uniref:Transposase n=1 Tax=Streptomyces levis TaxID=285566 RepID=A0ABP6B2Y6_9ACTN